MRLLIKVKKLKIRGRVNRWMEGEVRRRWWWEGERQLWDYERRKKKSLYQYYFFSTCHTSMDMKWG